MPRLMHPQHAVHALHRAAGSHRPLNTAATAPYDSRQFGSSFWQRSSCTRGRHMARPATRRVRRPRPLPTQPPQVHQGGSQRSSATASPSWRCSRSRNVNDSSAWSSPGPWTTRGPTAAARPRRPARRPRPVVHPPSGRNSQRRVGLLPTRFALLLRERGLGLLPGRCARSPAPRVAALPLRLVDRSAGGLGLLPEPLHSVPSAQDAPGLLLGVEDIQPLLQRDGLPSS